MTPRGVKPIEQWCPLSQGIHMLLFFWETGIDGTSGTLWSICTFCWTAFFLEAPFNQALFKAGYDAIAILLWILITY